MAKFWDYDEKKLKKTEWGRLKILERMINHGPDWQNGEKIDLAEVKKNWEKLRRNLFTNSRRLMELLIWGKYQPSPNDKNKFWA